MNAIIIGQRIKQNRQRLGLTQSQLAAELCVTNKAVSSWECGHSIPDVTLLPKISGLFGITLDELLSDDATVGALPSAPAPKETVKPKKKPSKRFLIIISSIAAAIVITLSILIPVLVSANSRPTITLRSESGMITQRLRADKDGYISQPRVVKAGYKVDGWFTDAEFTDEWNFETRKAEKDMSLYVRWTPVTYTITYYLDGGTASGNPDSYTVESPDITLSRPKKSAVAFAGWSLNENLTDPKMDVTIKTGTTGNLTYYASYKNSNMMINFDSCGGSECDPVPYNGQPEDFELPPNPTRDNYGFDGWFWDKGVWSKPFTFNSIFDKPITETMPLTVYAKWKISVKNKVTKPTLSQTSFVFDGTQKTVSVPENPAYYLDGIFNAIYASEYYTWVKLTDPAEYEWSDGTTEAFMLYWSIEKSDSPPSFPSNLTAGFGERLYNIELPYGWAWENSENLVGNTGTRTHNAIYSPEDYANYNVSTHGLSVKVTHSISNIRTEASELWWDSVATMNRILFEIGGVFQNPVTVNGGIYKKFSISEIPENATAIGIEQLNAQGVAQERVVMSIREASETVVSIYSIGSSNNMSFDSPDNSHTIYFLYGNKWTLYGNCGKSFSLLELPTDASKMRILPATWDYNESTKILTKPLPYDVPIATVTPSDGTFVKNLTVKGNILSWDLNTNYSNYRIYAFMDDEWQFIGMSSSVGNKVNLAPYDYSIGTTINIKRATKIRIAPVGWNNTVYNSVNNDANVWHIVRVTPTVIPIVQNAKEMITNIRVEGNSLRWDSPSTYHILDAKVDGNWRSDGEMSGGNTGGSRSLDSGFSDYEAYRIDPSITVCSYDAETATLQITDSLPTLLSIKKTQEAIRPVTNVRIENLYLKWNNNHGGQVMRSYKIDGEWQESVYNGYGDILIRDIPEGISAIRLTPINGAAYSFDSETITVIRHTEMLETEVMFEESAAAFEAFSNVQKTAYNIEWSIPQNVSKDIYFKIDGEWVLNISDYWLNNFYVSNIPENATDIKIILKSDVHTVDADLGKITRHTNILPLEFSL